MSQVSDADRSGVDIAVVGLRGAFRRCMGAYERMNPDDDLMFIAHSGLARASIVEFVVWACTLDEWLRRSDPTYAGRRDTDEHGRVLTALRALSETGTCISWPQRRSLEKLLAPAALVTPLQPRLSPGTSSPGEHGSIGAS